MKKLIDWATVPTGTQLYVDGSDILYELRHVSVDTANGFCIALETEGARGGVTMRYAYTSGRKCIAHDGIFVVLLRIAPAEQQPWLLYEEGKTVIPEWLNFECVYLGEDIAIMDKCLSQGALIPYRITGIKDGWTDNPNEVTE